MVLGSIIMKKATGGDGIPAELLNILKDDALKVLNMSAWKRAVATGLENSAFIPVPKRALTKSVQATVQLHLFHTLEKCI